MYAPGPGGLAEVGGRSTEERPVGFGNGEGDLDRGLRETAWSVPFLLQGHAQGGMQSLERRSDVQTLQNVNRDTLL